MKTNIKKLLSSTALLFSVVFMTMNEEAFSSTEEIDNITSQRLQTYLKNETPGIMDQPSPSLPVLLEELINKEKTFLLVRVKKYNPSMLLEKFCQELKSMDKSTPEWEENVHALVLKGMLAFSFHHQMTGESTTEAGQSFLKTLIEVTKPVSSIATSSQGQKSSLPLRKGKKGEKTHPQSSSSSKRMFSGVPKTTADQRELLQKLYDQDTTVMSGILKAFFHSSSVIVSKEEIRKKITSFQEEIKDHTRSGSDPVLGKKNNHLYEAALFRANWALKACVSLGKKCYVEGNVSEARAWFARAIETAEYAPAMYQWACLEERENNEAEVRRLLTLGAQRGHVDSIHNLAVLEGEKGNTAEAKRLFMLAIEKGDVDSICNLAIMEYRNGNIDNAIELFRLGAKKEHAVSMHNLAALEYKNNNIDNARKWYKESANRGCVSAREYLGNILQEI